MTTANDHLEKLFADSYKRELEGDENIARSLPFFAATLALVATVLGYAGAQFPPPSFNGVSILLHALLVVSALVLAFVLYCLVQAVRARFYFLMPAEIDFAEWAAGLEPYVAAEGFAGDELRDEVGRRVAQAIIDGYARSAEQNRANNRVKYGARARGLTALVFVMALAFAMVAIMFAEQQSARVHPPGAGNATKFTTADPGDASPQGGCETVRDWQVFERTVCRSAAPTDVGSRGGRQVPIPTDRGTKEVTDNSQPSNEPTPAESPQPAAAAPPPPPLIPMKKNDD